MTIAPNTDTTIPWPRIGTGIGRSHGTSTTTAFDRWFRYPAGFASDYAELLLGALELRAGLVVDCFAGSGVTGTAARHRGFNFFGIEAHPLIAELAALKLTKVDPELVEAFGEAVAEEVAGRAATPEQRDSEPDLVLRSFEPEVLDELCAIRDAIKTRGPKPEASVAKWALLATLRDVAGVKVGWPYQRPALTRKARHRSALTRFQTRLTWMIEDLRTIDAETTGQVVNGDSRRSDSWASLVEPAAACVSSPPYLNNFDYADATRLELYFWGEITSWRAMTAEVRAEMLTATTQQSSKSEMLESIEFFESHETDASRQVRDLVALTKAARLARGNRGKEYDQVVPAYFHAMSTILGRLYDNLAPGASALWLIGDSAPYGVYVDTPKIIGSLGEERGFSLIDDVSLRERGLRWASNGDRHKVPLSERLIVLRKPPGNE